VEGIPIDVRLGGTLPNVPDAPGVYVLVCRLMGATEHTLGEVLYVGLSSSLRRRVAYALGSAGAGKTVLHGVQRPLAEFQAAGGEADVLYVVVEKAEEVPGLEAALIQEHLHRAGARPAWNRTVPKTRPSPAATKLAEGILDALNVRPR
jgi:excinuclease UvrABC nuclease subunit